MDQRTIGKEMRMRERAEIVRECRRSGMSVTAWYREKDICKPNRAAPPNRKGF